MSDTSVTQRPGHTRIDNRIITDYAPRLGPIPLAVYVALASFANCDTRQCYPSISTLARLVRVSYPTAQKAIRALESAGLIRAQPVWEDKGNRRPNLYTLLPVAGGQSPCVGVPNGVREGTKPTLEEQDLMNKRDDGAGARRARPQPRDANLDHPAVKAYRGVCKLTPDETQRAAIAGTVTDVQKWRAVMQAWLLAGYRKQNLAGMLDWYSNGIPQRRNGIGQDAGNRQFGFAGDGAGRREPREAEASEDAARRDAEWAALVGISQPKRYGGGE